MAVMNEYTGFSVDSAQTDTPEQHLQLFHPSQLTRLPTQALPQKLNNSELQNQPLVHY
jgi:hypothetical protein